MSRGALRAVHVEDSVWADESQPEVPPFTNALLLLISVSSDVHPSDVHPSDLLVLLRQVKCTSKSVPTP